VSIFGWARLWFVSGDRGRAWSMVALAVASLVALPIVQTIANHAQGALITTLAARDAAGFPAALAFAAGALAAVVPLTIFAGLIPDLTRNAWYRWLTGYTIERYLAQRAYYALGDRADVDNPDQRVAEEPGDFAAQLVTLGAAGVGALAGVIVPAFALWRIAPSLTVMALAYALAGSALGVVIFRRRLARLNNVQLEREADFRFGLIRIREHAESVAFYRGEEQERGVLRARFAAAIENALRLVRWQQTALPAFTNLYSVLPFAFTVLVLAPRVWTHGLRVGAVTEAIGDIAIVTAALGVVVTQLGALGQLGAAYARLAGLERACADAAALPATIGTRAADGVELDRLTLRTPDGTRTLFRDLDATLERGGSLVVRGPSGCGKSSLLRAIAGLWTNGAGTIGRPDLARMAFLPQTPYVALGTLRDQLSYPAPTQREMPESELLAVLETAGLAELPGRIGGFDADVDFARILSLGEQQRLAFARLLLAAPAIAILDEATSAVDAEREGRLYRELGERGITILSVAHRESVAALHAATLRFAGNGDWAVD